MEFDFENNKYFGHATDKNPISVNEDGIRIAIDVYGRSQLESTTIEITEDDIQDGIDNMLKEVFSIGNDFRKYVAIIGCEKDYYYDFYNDVKNNNYISPEYIIGCYDENNVFYENEQNYIL